MLSEFILEEEPEIKRPPLSLAPRMQGSQLFSAYRAFSLTWLAAKLVLWNKDDFNIKIEFNSQRTGLVHQHGRRFFILEHQYGRRDVTWKRSKEHIQAKTLLILECKTIISCQFVIGPLLAVLAGKVKLSQRVRIWQISVFTHYLAFVCFEFDCKKAEHAYFLWTSSGSSNFCILFLDFAHFAIWVYFGFAILRLVIGFSRL